MLALLAVLASPSMGWRPTASIRSTPKLRTGNLVGGEPHAGRGGPGGKVYHIGAIL